MLPAAAASTILKVARMQRLKNGLHLAPEIKRKRATLELNAIRFAHVNTHVGADRFTHRRMQNEGTIHRATQTCAVTYTNTLRNI